MLIEYGLGCHGGKSSDFACITEQASSAVSFQPSPSRSLRTSCWLQRTGYSAGACYRARRRRDPVAEHDGFI